MYDTINFRVEVAGEELPAILNRLENITEHVTNERLRHTGYLDNYKVYLSDAGILLHGSLSKYYLDNNISTLTKSDTARAIEKLSDGIGLKLMDAKVTRIDLGANLLMNRPPEAYYPFLIECQSYQRNMRKGSLYFNHGNMCMIFYNKIKEATAKGVTVPEIVQGSNLLRYELRIMKKVNQKLNADVTGAMLTDEKFYMRVVNRWHAEYQKIIKAREFMPNSKNMKTPKDYWKQKNEQALHIIGLDAALKEVDQLKAMQAFDKPEYYSRLKKQIKEMYADPATTEPNELIKELDRKIATVNKYYR